MDNRINELRKQIRALRGRMLEAEAVMHEQINRGRDSLKALVEQPAGTA